MSTADLIAAENASQNSSSKGPRLMDKQWEIVQKKTFTKWVNTQLQKGKISPLENLAQGISSFGFKFCLSRLFQDFSDGTKLLQLLEIIGDESLGKYYKAPKLRIQKCENMNKALEFIKQRGVNLTNIGAEDLVDQNEKLVLGMIWTIILRFTISDITEEGLTAKEGLLLWCQRKTAGYKNVAVKDFTFSWADGLALCALIHRHRPDLLDFDQLNKNNKKENVALAFDVAEKHLNIPKLLDVEDLADITKPDERSVMTYVAQYFHAFSALDKVEVAGRRVGKFAGVIKAAWEMEHEYERRARELVSALQHKIQDWEVATFSGTYADAKKQSTEFLTYKNTSKREWVAEKRELDTLLSNIVTKLRTYNLAAYTPPAGLTVADMDSAWKNLLSAEHARRKAINDKIHAIKEELRVNYSKLANEFEAELNSISVSVGALDGELQSQLDSVNTLSKRVAAQESKLNEVSAVDNKCNEAGLDENDREYTVYSVDDLQFDLGLVSVVIQKKKAFLENQIVARSMTNMTPQQLEEFESTFKAFDKDNSNALSRHEFKACLASLGKDYDDKEFEEIFSKLSSGADFVKFEQFTKYMVSITEDRTSADQLISSFRAISKGKEYITEMDMRVGQVPAEEVEYLKSVLPPYDGVDNAYDYQAYLQSVFA